MKHFKTLEGAKRDAFFKMLDDDPQVSLELLEEAQKDLVNKIPENLDLCVKAGLIKEIEKDLYSQDYLAEYINIAAHIAEFKQDVPIFVTAQEEVLKRRASLEKAFGVTICTIKEAGQRLMEEEEKKDKEANRKE